jgi:hypothetical protein
LVRLQAESQQREYQPSNQAAIMIELRKKMIAITAPCRGLNDVGPSRIGRLEASVEVFERLFQLSGLGFHPRRRLLAAVARGGA